MPPLLMMAAFAALLAIFALVARNAGIGRTAESGRAAAAVCFMDVGQGDAIFIGGGASNVLIDTGDQPHSEALAGSLRGRGVTSIDAIICTHPHNDHIGGLEAIIGSFGVGRIYMPRVISNTRTFERAMGAIGDRRLDITAPGAGDALELPGGIRLAFLGPMREDDMDINNSSIIVKAELEMGGPIKVTAEAGGLELPEFRAGGGGTLTILLMADAEREAERLLLESGADVRADVIKIGHHGSVTSTGEEFLAAVNPSYAVIQCGGDNPYGHPDAAVIDLLTSRGITILRTDVHGAITFGR
jgi:competence protein ComEC